MGQFSIIDLSGTTRGMAIRRGQFHRSLTESLRNHLLTAASREGEKIAQSE